MKNIKLEDLEENIERGVILRCKGQYPYEEYVDFMVIEQQNQYALLVVSGYKAGLIFVCLPKESIPQDNNGYAIDLGWLKSNWNEWGYSDCPINDVHVIYKDFPTSFSDR